MTSVPHSGAKSVTPGGSVAGGAVLTYAIGDVHGCADLLVKAFDLIAEDAGERRADIVCLGDYVDRGPDSMAVVQMLMKGPHREGDTLVCLKGNHEDLMVNAIGGDDAAESCWIGNGGRQTVISYCGHIPPEHVVWMASLPVMHEDHNRVYVHAGLMPGMEIGENEPEVCMWIRDRFLREKGGWAKHIVHGHTPQWDGKPDPAEPELLAHRTNLDTAAFHTGVLTVGVFDPEQSGGPIRTLRAAITKATAGETRDAEPIHRRDGDEG